MSLTKKQKQVYDFIADYLNSNGYSPTQVEIQEHFGLKSKGSVHDYVRYLKNSGHLQDNPNQVRGLTPTSAPELTTAIPWMGHVAAGKPLEVVEVQEEIQVPNSMVKKGKYFALTVQGDSMVEDAILDGDIIIVKSQTDAKNGETIVALWEGGATVKRLYRKEKKVELHPANSNHKPFIISKGELNIQGIVAGLIRKY